MGPVPVVILLPCCQRFSGLAQCSKQRFVQAFIAQLTVEALDEAVLLWFARCDVMPVDPGLLNPFEDSHAGELGPVI